MKKAYELGVLCNAEVALIIFAQNGKTYQFSSNGNIDGTLYRYAQIGDEPIESKGPEDFGGTSAGSTSRGVKSDDEDSEGEGEANVSQLREESVLSSDHEPPPPVSKRASARKVSSSKPSKSPIPPVRFAYDLVRTHSKFCVETQGAHTKSDACPSRA
jgi:hypothetical protein